MGCVASLFSRENLFERERFPREAACNLEEITTASARNGSISLRLNRLARRAVALQEKSESGRGTVS